MQSPFTSTQQQQQPGQPGQYGQTMQQMQGQMTGGLERMREWLQQWIQNSADTLRVYVNQYPPLAAFLFTLLILSAVPVSVYVVFALVTSGILLTIALIGFSCVEGFILLTSGGILMAILGGIALFTTIAFSIVGAMYVGYRGACFVAQNLWQVGGQVKESVQRGVGQMQQQMPSGTGFQASYTPQSGLGASAGMGTSGTTSS